MVGGAGLHLPALAVREIGYWILDISWGRLDYEIPNTQYLLCLVPRYRLDVQALAETPHYFAFLGMTPFSLLAVDHFVIGQHFKAAPTGRDEFDVLDDRCEVLQ